MTAKPPPARPHTGPQAEAARVARLEREAAALRENLRRRKAQSRARDAGSDSEGDSGIDSGSGQGAAGGAVNYIVES